MNYGIITYILGWVTTLEGLFLLIPCLCALIYQEKSGFSFLIVSVLSILIGLCIIRKKPKNQQFFAKEGFIIVGLSWIFMSIIGALPFVLNGDIPSFTDALFETISGFTTTGASILSDIESLSRCSLLWRSFTHWIGGMGVFVFLLSVLPMAGGYNMHLMRAESPGPSVGKLVPKVKETAKILYLIYIFITLMEFVALMIAGMPIFDAITTTFGTAGTGGFGIRGDSIAGYSASIQWIVTIFMILFGVNFNTYFYLIGKNKRNALKIEEVHWYFAIIIIASGLIAWNISDMTSGIGESIRLASFQVASIITTTGFATADFNLWPSLSRTILMMIACVGACAGSTGGGLKVSRLIILFKEVRHEILSFIHPRSVKSIELDGKPLDKTTVRAVCVFLATLVTIFVCSLFLISFDQYDPLTNFTAVIATINNIGPGLEIVGPCGGFGGFSVFSKYVLMFDMLAGRLELYPILILFSPSTWKRN